MHQNAEHGHAGDGHGARQQQRPAEPGIEPIDHIHAAHDEVGIGDPHHVDHAEDQVEAKRKERQHAAEQNAVDDRFEEIDVHRRYNPKYALRMNSWPLSSLDVPASLMLPTSSR